MHRLISLLIVAVALAVLAACGSSSTSSQTTATKAPSAGPGPSVPVTSVTFRAVLLHDLRYGSHPLSLPVAKKAADCGIRRFLSQGIKTYGDFVNPKNAAIERQDGIECARQTGYRK